uniref:Predicted protein n=1 Tax=Hordeum vulgare subsp. vulgare TaxID=112509 RepID=F2EDN3_HORVV|nr:predicted protein [Hordeum vulgare subsp. vulgare]
MVPPSFFEVCKSKPVHKDKWRALAPDDEKLGITIDHMLWLRAVGLTIEMVGSDIIARCIALIQDRKRFSLEYVGLANALRLSPMLNGDLTYLQLVFFRHQLVHSDDKFILPPSVIPLYNNSCKDAIVATMSACYAHVLEPMW